MSDDKRKKALDSIAEIETLLSDREGGFNIFVSTRIERPESPLQYVEEISEANASI